jgi:hypothetical protein
MFLADMKTSALWAIVFLLCHTAMANETTPVETFESGKSRLFAFTTQPSAILFGDYHIQTEIRVFDSLSLVFPVGVFAPNWSPFYLTTGLDPSSYNGVAFPGWIVGGGLGPRLYPFGKALTSGLFLEFVFFAGVGRTFGLNNTVALIQQRYHFGYSLVTNFGLVVDVFGGFQQSNFSNIEGQGFVPTAGLGLGWAL